MNTKLAWTLRIIPAVIIGQTLPFKFSGAAESVGLFSSLSAATLGDPGLEAIPRIGTGVVELIAIVLLLIPKHSLKGALLVIGTMMGALASHAFIIGFTGYEPLAVMAVIALVTSAIFVLKSKVELLKLIGSLKKSSNSL